MKATAKGVMRRGNSALKRKLESANSTVQRSKRKEKRNRESKTRGSAARVGGGAR